MKDAQDDFGAEEETQVEEAPGVCGSAGDAQLEWACHCRKVRCLRPISGTTLVQHKHRKRGLPLWVCDAVGEACTGDKPTEVMVHELRLLSELMSKTRWSSSWNTPGRQW